MDIIVGQILKSCTLLFSAGIIFFTSVLTRAHAGEYIFDYTFKALPSITIQDPADSTQNPDNDFLDISSYLATLDVRLDLSLDYKAMTLDAKPRLSLEWERWTEGQRDGESDFEDRWFFNEWLVGARPVESLFLSFGKEFIQWGPSWGLNSSNPFFRDNGLSNPKVEIQGTDFATLVWVPSSSWSVSLLANVFEDRHDQRPLAEFFSDFERAYAIKLDYTGYRKYFSLIPSYREPDSDEQDINDSLKRLRLGGFAGWTVSDALLLYGEGVGFLRTDALYPVDDPATPYGIAMRPTEANRNSFGGIVQLGASYTLEIGPTLTIEYTHNSAGYDDGEADRYYDLRRSASETFSAEEPLRSLSRLTLSQTLDPKLRLLRKNYVLLQYLQVQIWDLLDVVLRYTHNLDDNSGQINPVIEYFPADYFELFLVGVQNFGSSDSEFGSLVDYSWMFGAEFTF